MNLTLMVKLMPTTEQHQALLETMERFNAACNAIAEAAFEHRTANKIRLQKLVYDRIRKEFGLSAQMTVRAISIKNLRSLQSEQVCQADIQTTWCYRL